MSKKLDSVVDSVVDGSVFTGRAGGTGSSFGWAKIELLFMEEDNVFRVWKVTC